MSACTHADIRTRRQELLDANTLRCTAADIGMNPQPGMEQDTETLAMIEDIDKYLADFAKPVKRESGKDTGFLFGGVECLCCGKPLVGMLGTFKWGIANGEGNCSACGWPVRMYHNICDRSGKSIFEERFSSALQYHPDGVVTSEERDRQLHPEDYAESTH